MATSSRAASSRATSSRTSVKRTDSLHHIENQVRQTITKDFYDVTKLYHNRGFSQWIAKQPRFEQMTLLVIALNAIWIWVDTDLNPGTALILSPPLFQFVEHVFCMYFSYEWTMRFLAFRTKQDGLRDFWFVFDSLLVASMVFETWILSAVFLCTDSSGSGGMSNTSILRLARLLRLTRMGRMVRVLRALPELLILIKGMVAALRSVCFALGLLLMILYVFGIAFTQLCEGTALEPEFATVLISMHTLLISGALMDEVSTMIKTIEAVSIPMLILFYVFILLAALTVMNMLIGVICEMVLKVGEEEREASTLAFVTEKIEELILSTGADENSFNLISRDEFKEMLSNTKAVSILHEVGVDVVGLVDFADTIFEAGDGDDAQEEKQLTFGEFMGLILDLRGSKTARVKDIVGLRKHINYRFQQLESRLMDMDCVAQYHRARNGVQEAPVSSERTARGAQVLADVRAIGTQSSGQPPGVTTMATIQDIVKGSLLDLQASHELELSILRNENLQLLKKLTDLRKAAEQSSADVQEVSAKVPRTAQGPTGSTTSAFSKSVGAALTAAAGFQPTASPTPSRDLSQLSRSSTRNTSPLAPQLSLQQWQLREYHSIMT